MAESNFTVRVDDELKEAFTKAAKAADRTGGQLIRDFMRDYVREREDYNAWLAEKIERARKDIEEGRFLTQEEVNSRAAARKIRILGRAKARVK